MEHTFSFWRRKILEFPKSIINVIKQYPSLRRPQQVNYFVHVCYTASSLIKWLFLQILADLERVMGKSVKCASFSYTYRVKPVLTVALLAYLLPDTQITQLHNKIYKL